MKKHLLYKLFLVFIAAIVLLFSSMAFSQSPVPDIKINNSDGIAWPEGNIQENRYTRKLQAIKRHYDIEIPKALNRLGKAFTRL